MDHTPICRTGDVNCLSDLKDAIIQQKWSFFRSYDITDLDGLLNFAMQSAEAWWYVETFLHLRYKKSHRHDVHQLFNGEGRWIQQCKGALWHWYCLERDQFVRRVCRDDIELADLTKTQIAHLSGLTCVRKRKLNRSTTAKTHRATVIGSVKDEAAVIWLDNYNKLRYSRNLFVDQRNLTLSGT